jgi:glycosyltransferase involved in cell wall biosynthesis
MTTAPAPVPSCPPGVSVVVPAYNHALFLPKALDSALQQTHREIEVIVVDDGSTDDTAEVVSAFTRRDPRIRYIHQKNAGLPAARNAGISHARHEFIGFLDADDLWLPEFLRRTMEAFARLPPEFAIVACRAIYIDGEGQRLIANQRDAALPGEITCRDIILKTRFSPSAVVARKAALAESGCFDVTLRSSEDRDMWIRIAARHRVHLLRDPLALIRRHPGNMSKHADRMKANVRTVINKAHRARLVPPTDWLFWLRVLSFHYYQNAWRYRDEGRHGKALCEMLLSLSLWPCFAHPALLNAPPLFRARGLARFAVELLGKQAPGPGAR